MIIKYSKTPTAKAPERPSSFKSYEGKRRDYDFEICNDVR